MMTTEREMTETAWAHETFEAGYRSARRQAEANFAGHVVKHVAPFEWRCEPAGSDFLAFGVIVRAGFVILYGAQGQGVFCGGEAKGTPEYTLEWLGEATGKGDYALTYLCSKLQGYPQEFYVGDALEWARERAEDHRRFVPLFEAACEAYEDGELREDDWIELLSTHASDSDAWSVATKYAPKAVWLCEVLRWFCAHLPTETAVTL